MNRFLEPVLLDGVTATSSGPTTIDHSEPPLSAPLTLSFDYTRSVGPTLGKFFTALRERRVLGVRGSDGRVHVPPAEYDPVTYEPLGEMVPVASVGTVVSWTWQPEPLGGEPLDRPVQQPADQHRDQDDPDDPQRLARGVAHGQQGCRKPLQFVVVQPEPAELQFEGAFGLQALGDGVTHQLDIVRMVGEGLRNRAIAARLSISEGTVKVHLHNIYEKLGVDGRLELTLCAQQKGLL